MQNLNNVFVCGATTGTDAAYARAAPVVEALSELALLWPGCGYLQPSLSAVEVKTKVSPVVDERHALIIASTQRTAKRRGTISAPDPARTDPEKLAHRAARLVARTQVLAADPARQLRCELGAS